MILTEDYFGDLKLPFGKMPDGRLVSVRDVDRGLDCNCVCPQCNGRLVAKKGEVLRHHFAHESTACGPGALETSLHKMGKQIIFDAGSFWAPEAFVVFPISYAGENVPHQIRRRFAKSTWLRGSVEIEKTIGDIRPDVVLTTASGSTTAAEIYVTHSVSAEKTATIRSLNLSAIEIDISRYPRDLDVGELEDYVLRQAPRWWVHHDKQAEFLTAIKAEYLAAIAAEREKEEQQAAAVRAAQAAFEANQAALAALRQRERDFAEAARIEAEKAAAKAAEENAWLSELYPYPVRIGQIRASKFASEHAITPGALCSSCEGTAWCRSADGCWTCIQCHGSYAPASNAAVNGLSSYAGVEQ